MASELSERVWQHWCDRPDLYEQKTTTFLQALRGNGHVAKAALAAGIGRQTVYLWRHQDRQFLAAMDDIKEHLTDDVEESLYRKAVSGDVVSMIFWLKANRPIYKDHLRIDVKTVQAEIEDRMARLKLSAVDVLANAVDQRRQLGPANEHD